MLVLLNSDMLAGVSWQALTDVSLRRNDRAGRRRGEDLIPRAICRTGHCSGTSMADWPLSRMSREMWWFVTNEKRSWPLFLSLPFSVFFLLVHSSELSSHFPLSFSFSASFHFFVFCLSHVITFPLPLLPSPFSLSSPVFVSFSWFSPRLTSSPLFFLCPHLLALRFLASTPLICLISFPVSSLCSSRLLSSCLMFLPLRSTVCSF